MFFHFRSVHGKGCQGVSSVITYSKVLVTWAEHLLLDAMLRTLICCYLPTGDGNGFENTFEFWKWTNFLEEHRTVSLVLHTVNLIYRKEIRLSLVLSKNLTSIVQCGKWNSVGRSQINLREKNHWALQLCKKEGSQNHDTGSFSSLSAFKQEKNRLRKSGLFYSVELGIKSRKHFKPWSNMWKYQA